MRFARLGDCDLVVDPWFAAMLVLLGSLGRIAEAVILCGSLLSHELAHLAAGRGFGLKFRQIRLYPFGGVADVENIYTAERGALAATALAGPLNSLALFGLGSLLAASGWMHPALADPFLEMNLLLAFVNLMPALPLDGGRVLQAVLRHRTGELRSQQVLVGLGYTVAAGMGLGTLVAAGFGIYLPTVPVLAFFVALAARRERPASVAGSLRAIWQRPAQLAEKRVLPGALLVASETMSVRELLHSFDLRAYHLVYVVDDQLRLRGTLTETEIVRAVLEEQRDRTLGDLLASSRPPLES